jgi:hypothetical protein
MDKRTEMWFADRFAEIVIILLVALFVTQLG